MLNRVSVLGESALPRYGGITTTSSAVVPGLPYIEVRLNAYS